MSEKILIAYRTRLSPRAPAFDATSLVPPANFNNENVIAKWRAKKIEEAATAFLQQPYTAVIDSAIISVPLLEEQATFSFRPPGGQKQCAELAIRAWILKRFPTAWSNKTRQEPGEPAAIFIGFNPRLFLKILGTECSLPVHRVENTPLGALPLNMWYGNTDHRDIGEAVMPDEYKFLTWPMVLQARGLDKAYGDWKGPGVNPEIDLRLMFELAAQLGMLER